jgi:hypothetical protein
MSKKVMQKIVSIEKQELSAEKIDLSSVDVLKKKTSEAKSFLKKYNKGLTREINNAVQTLKEARKLNDDGFSLRGSGAKDFRAFGRKAQELGVDFLDIPEVKEYLDTMRELDEINSQILKAIPSKI